MVDWTAIYTFILGIALGAIVTFTLLKAHQIKKKLKEDEIAFNKSMEEMKDDIRKFYGL